MIKYVFIVSIKRRKKKLMFHRKNKSKNVEYTGDITVCLDKAYKFRDLKYGREFIGNLTSVRIRAQRLGNRDVLSNEHTLAVPVFICNKNEQSRNINVDWTRSNSPITEMKYKPLQRWWPKSMFRGVSKIGEEEEVILEYSNFSIKLRVIYAFSSETKEIFGDIEKTDVDMDKITTEVFPEPNNCDRLEFASTLTEVIEYVKPELTDKNRDEEGVKYTEKKLKEIIKTIENKEIIPMNQDKPERKLKIAIGAGILMAISFGLFYGVRLFISKRNS
jgi:hypothetical protein